MNRSQNPLFKEAMRRGGTHSSAGGESSRGGRRAPVLLQMFWFTLKERLESEEKTSVFKSVPVPLLDVPLGSPLPGLFFSCLSFLKLVGVLVTLTEGLLVCVAICLCPAEEPWSPAVPHLHVCIPPASL